MKTSFHLSQPELSQAVADFVAKKMGKDIKVDVQFQVTANYDFADRPTGTSSISAIASFSAQESE